MCIEKYKLTVMKLYVLLPVLLTLARSQTTNKTVILDAILAGYDKRLSPYDFSGNTITVQVDVTVSSISSVSELSMEYVFHGYIRERWLDYRLDYSKYRSNDTITLDTVGSTAIWHPDLFIQNAKGKSTTSAFRFTKLHPNGTIYTSTGYSLPVSCNMDLRKFPMDNQTCHFKIESYAYTSDILNFIWLPTTPININLNQIRTAQYTVTHYRADKCDFTAVTGIYSCLNLSFYLKRNVGYYLIQTIVPTVLIVFISWINFWITHKAVPARCAVAVTCVLTMVTQAASIRASLPKVSYIKAIDIWTTGCSIFVFAALFEYAIVNVLARKERPRYYEVDQYDTDDMKLAENQELINGPSGSLFRVEFQPVHNRERRARSIDSLARRIFPLAFLLFNLVFWLVYELWVI